MSFERTLHELGDGRVLSDLEDALVELVAAVRRCGSKGELTLKLAIAPAEVMGDTATVALHGRIAVKVPRPARAGAVMYVRDDGLLSNRDPRQPSVDTVPTLSVVDGQRKAAGDRD